MAEHRIRLRGGWEWQDPLPTSGRRVTLPCVWPTGLTTRTRLLRPFQAPPIDPTREALFLQMDAISGLVAAWFNGNELVRPAPGTSSVLLALGLPLPPRNVLVLEVDPTSATVETPWGEIALVIRPVEA